ncbi:MAG TPA: cupin domain-containing protein [Pseudonocardiaceae bacterium]|nr:cupin domain-containing protein [Pseudonocardiaceae bacterium]
MDSSFGVNAKPESSLAWLLEPLTVQSFFEDVWGATHYHIKRGAPGYFDRLLPGPSAAEELLEHARPEPAAVRLVKGDEHRDSDAYQRADGSLDLAGVRNDLADGYTIILDSLERYARSITSLSHAIEVELNFPVQVNAYITPPGSAGFLPHYDHHDVLILQIQGSKVWHLHGDAAVPPHEMQRRQEVDPDALPLPTDSPTDLRLEAGDTLYLPRGRVHAAETTSESSVHLTVGIHVPTVLTLLTHTLHLLSLRDDRVHARLPPRHLDDPDVRAGLGGLLHDVLTTIEDPDALAEGLGAMEDVLVRRGRCPPVGQTADTVGIDGQTRVVKYQPLYSRVTAVAGAVALQFAQLLISAGSDHEAAMRFLSESSEPFRVNDLPGLNAAQQAELARTLIVSGFLVRLPDN